MVIKENNAKRLNDTSVSPASLITEHLNLWTNAIKPKASSGRGRGNGTGNGKYELYGIKKLRELILELAVRGLLVPQDPNDESSSELLKRFKSEKDSLLKKGVIKKKKRMKEIDDAEKLYTLPEIWEWARLGDLCLKVTDGSHNPPKDAGHGFPMLSSQNIRDGKIDFNSPSRYISAEDFEREDSRTSIQSNDVLLNIVASIGRSAVVPLNAPKFALQRSVAVLTSQLNPFFLSYLLVSPLCMLYYDKHAKGTAQKGIYLGKLSMMPLPVPPENEQYRIVTKVDELMALCDQLEEQTEQSIDAHKQLVETLLNALTNAKDNKAFSQAWERISENFDVLFTTEDSIEQLKQTILQLAVMGKLVPQDPSDEPASELLKKIATEKQKLFKEGKIKKQKPLPPIPDEEKPFKPPNGWVFERLGHMAKLITKGSSPKWQGVSYTNDPEDVLFVTSENVGSFKLVFKNKKYVEKKFNKVEPRSILCKNDYLMNIVGASIGRVAIYDIDELANINQAVCLIRLFTEYLYGEYFLNFFNSNTCLSYMFDKQVDNARPNLSMTNIAKFIIPVPPVEEQERITLKVDELLSLCDSLKQKVASSKELELKLADAFVGNVT